jgi:hypothetical protein
MTRFAPWKVSLTLVCLVVGLLALSHTMSSGQVPKEPPPIPASEPGAPPMVPTWEYKTIFGTASQSNDDQMNELGSKGWTLDTVVEEPNSVVRFVFKRSTGWGRR